MSAPVHLVQGRDESLLRDEVMTLVDRLAGTSDRAVTVSEFELTGESGELVPIVNAAQTPPFLSDRRVLVLRRLHLAVTEELAPLVAYLRQPLASTALVLVWEAGRVPKRLTDAVRAAGGELVDASPKRGWLDEHVRAAGVRLDATARQLMVEHLGEDVARLRGVLEALESAYGSDARLGVDEVAPYLGEAGSAPPWELTEAIDRGEIPKALDLLHRMLGAGQRHALQVMATLHTHVGRMLALDGANVKGDRDAAELLGLRGSTFPAKKALEQARRLGSERIARAIALLAQADLDLKGAKDLPDHLVLEVLVARLANLSRR